MYKVLITGINGQDGSFLADHILKTTSHNVIGLARASRKLNDKNYKHLLNNPRFQLILGDISDFKAISFYFEKYQPDFLFNFAAQSNPSLDDNVKTYTVNTVGVLNCLEVIRLYKPSCKFFNAGSSQESFIKNIYGLSKDAAYNLVEHYKYNYNIFAVHAILHTHTSERQGEEFIARKITKEVARIYHTIHKGEDFAPMEIGNLEARRPFAFAGDFVETIWKIMNSDDCNRFFTLCGKEFYTIREFIEEAFKVVMHIEKVNYMSNVCYTYSNSITKNKPIVVINPKLFRANDLYPNNFESNLEEKTSFKDLVKRMVNYDIDNYDN